MTKIKNQHLAGQKTATAAGMLHFDEHGLVDVEDAHAEELLTVAGFTREDGTGGVPPPQPPNAPLAAMEPMAMLARVPATLGACVEAFIGWEDAEKTNFLKAIQAFFPEAPEPKLSKAEKAAADAQAKADEKAKAEKAAADAPPA